MLFVLWAERVLTKEGAATAESEGRHAAEEDELRRTMIEDGEPTEILDYLTGQLPDSDRPGCCPDVRPVRPGELSVAGRTRAACRI